MNIPLVRFRYPSNRPDQNKELVCREIVNAVSAHIELPKEIIIQFTDLGESVYAETSIDFRFKNRISLSDQLTTGELPVPLVHELIHVNQSHLGVLKASRSGAVFWQNKLHRFNENMSYEQHQALPWEMDVTNRHAALLQIGLKGIQ